VFACFVDFQKAFDTAMHTGIKIKLLENGIGHHFYNIIKSMYSQSKPCVRLNNTLTDFLFYFDSCMHSRVKGFLEVNKAGEHPAIFIIAVFINYGLQDKHVTRQYK
jgi:hypothetical protein